MMAARAGRVGATSRLARLLAPLLALACPARGAYLHGGLLRVVRSSGSSRSLLRMAAGASPDTASHGLLYEGWGAEGLRSLNESNTLLDEADDSGVNRYDLTRIVAAKAKEIAYAHVEDDEMLNPMLSGTPRKPKSKQSEVIRAIVQLQDEMRDPQANKASARRMAEEDDLGLELDEDELGLEEEDMDMDDFKLSPAEEARAGAAAALAGPPPVAASLDGDGGAANLQALNRELLDAAAGEDVARAGSAQGAADASAELVDDGFDALLADLSEVDMEDDDLADLDLDLDSLFGAVGASTEGSIESSGIHPGDAGRT